MKFKSIILRVASAAVLATVAGCGKPVNSVEFYLEDKDARIAAIHRCNAVARESRDKWKKDEDCQNVFKAIGTMSSR